MAFISIPQSRTMDFNKLLEVASAQQTQFRPAGEDVCMAVLGNPILPRLYRSRKHSEQDVSSVVEFTAGSSFPI